MQKFFICKHCKNLLGLIDNHGVPLVCCGEKMAELHPNTVEASAEKHIPIVKRTGSCITVDVGSVLHPMAPEHNIQFIYLETGKGGQRKNPVGEPKAVFEIVDDEPIAVYEYCNLHGLWKADIK